MSILREDGASGDSTFPVGAQVQKTFSKIAGVIEEQVSRSKSKKGDGVRLARTEAEYHQVLSDLLDLNFF
jgi:hypothetical protein